MLRTEPADTRASALVASAQAGEPPTAVGAGRPAPHPSEMDLASAPADATPRHHGAAQPRPPEPSTGGESKSIVCVASLNREPVVVDHTPFHAQGPHDIER